MDTTITTEEVTTANGTLPSLDPRPNANICVLCVHIECALQLLPCPQSVHHVYALLVTGGVAFRDPNDPRAAAVYMQANPADLTPLSCTEQATIEAAFARQKHYFTSYTNINLVVYAALCTSISKAFQVSNIPGVAGWPDGMGIHTMLDQLSSIYGFLTPAALEQNDNKFCREYTPADAPEVPSVASRIHHPWKSIHGPPYRDEHNLPSPHHRPLHQDV